MSTAVYPSEFSSSHLAFVRYCKIDAIAVPSKNRIEARNTSETHEEKLDPSVEPQMDSPLTSGNEEWY